MKITKDLLVKHNVSPDDIQFYVASRIVGKDFSEIQALKFQKNPALHLVHNAYYSMLEYYIDTIKALIKAENKGQILFDCTEILKDESTYKSNYFMACSWRVQYHHIERCSYINELHDMVKTITYNNKNQEVQRMIKDSYANKFTYTRKCTYLNDVLLSVTDSTGIYTFVYTKDYKELQNILYQSVIIM